MRPAGNNNQEEEGQDFDEQPILEKPMSVFVGGKEENPLTETLSYKLC